MFGGDMQDYISESGMIRPQLEKEIAELKARLAKEWLPISEAPEDGTQILVWGENYDGEIIYGLTRWIKKEEYYWQQQNEDTQKRIKCDESHWDYSFEGCPTHFQFLPKPPTE